MDMRFKFNEDAKNYDKYRPNYPEELFKDIISYADLTEQSKGIEIGVGTGQATEAILKTGCKVKAIELGNNLAEYVKEKFKDYSNFEVVEDDFIIYQIKEKDFDLIYCATAFHWLPIEERYEKIKSLLKEKGTLAIFWNHPFPNRKDDITNIKSKEVYDKYRPSKEKAIEFKEEDCKKYVNELRAFEEDMRKAINSVGRKINIYDTIDLYLGRRN